MDNNNLHWLSYYLEVEGLKIELELSASDANVGILSSDSRQPIIEKSHQLEAGLLNKSDVVAHIVCFCRSFVGLYERKKQNYI